MARFDPEASLRLRALPEYEALDDSDALIARYGLDPAQVIKIDGNENPFGPSPRTLEALRQGYRAEWYPDERQQALRTALAKYVEVSPECVVAGSGSDELIDQVFRMYLGQGDRIVLVSPTFGMYAFDASLHGVEVEAVPLLDDFSFDDDALVRAAAGAKAVFIPSPNNPTGGLLEPELLQRILDTGTLLVVDEAYIEFSDAPSYARRAATETGLIVLRTLSKWGGLAGLRIGYGVMEAHTADLFMRAKQPYNINAAAEVAALASLEDAAVLDERAQTIVRERERVSAALARLEWIAPVPSQANFVLLHLAHGDGMSVRDALRARGIFTRAYKSPRLHEYLRISMGTPEQNDRVIAAFAEVGEELAHG